MASSGIRYATIDGEANRAYYFAKGGEVRFKCSMCDAVVDDADDLCKNKDDLSDVVGGCPKQALAQKYRQADKDGAKNHELRMLVDELNDWKPS